MRRSGTKHIVVHCSATKAELDVRAADIDSWHRARGWDQIGYHLVICRDAFVESGRHLDAVGAHVKGHNRQSIGVCLAGGIGSNGLPEKNFTTGQFDSLYKTIQFLRMMYPEAKVLGHRDLSPDLNGDGIIQKHEFIKDCPCFDVREWLSLRDSASSGMQPTPGRAATALQSIKDVIKQYDAGSVEKV